MADHSLVESIATTRSVRVRGAGSPNSPYFSHDSTPGEMGTRMKKWICSNCGWTYDEAKGDPRHGIPAGTRWQDVPEDWICPECGTAKSEFEMVAA